MVIAANSMFHILRLALFSEFQAFLTQCSGVQHLYTLRCVGDVLVFKMYCGVLF